METIPQKLKERHREWVRIVNDGDIDAYIGILTEDAVWIPPGGEPIEGREAFKKWLTPFLTKFSYRFDITEERIKAAGSRALERAKFTSKMSPKTGGNPMIHSGTFTVLWIQKEDNKWYIERYIDDTDL